MKRIYYFFVLAIIILLTGCVNFKPADAVIFYGNGGTLVSGETLQEIIEGKEIVAPLFEKEGYDFVGWDKDFSNATTNMKVYAIWEESKTTFTVVFKDLDGTVLKTEEVESGKSATPPTLPNHEGYEFSHWDQDFQTVTEDLIVQAIYNQLFTVEFFVNNELYHTDSVISGSSITDIWSEDPYYTFDGWYQDEEETIPWDFSTDVVTENIRLYATISSCFTYTESNNELTITGFNSLPSDKIVIPNQIFGKNVVSIGELAFASNQDLTEVTISDGIASIGMGAFYYCGYVTSITIPTSVTNIDDYAFYDCYSLESMVLPDSLTTLNDGLFYECYRLKSVVLPNQITALSDYLFYACYDLNDLVIPNSVETIGRATFTYCNSFTDYTITEGVKSIGYQAFAYCGNLTAIHFPSTLEEINGYAFTSTSLSQIDFPSGLTSIGSGAFYYCLNLTNVFIPENVEMIGASAFGGCENITSFSVDENNSFYQSLDDCIYSKDGKTIVQYPIAKEGIEYTIPDGVEIIGDFAFEGCLLFTVSFPNTVKEIQSGAFSDADRINNLVLPDGLERIGEGAFYYCNNLDQILIPSLVESIGDYAFGSCYSLSVIYIPKSVIYMGEGVFYDSSSVEILCETTSQPATWNVDWNLSGATVTWGYVLYD